MMKSQTPPSPHDGVSDPAGECAGDLAGSCRGSAAPRSAAGDLPDDRQEMREADRRIRAAWAALDSVADPEVPVVSVVELGMIGDVRIESEVLHVDVTPTFAGCPAIDLIRTEIKTALAAIDEATALVRVTFDPPWTTDRISADGRRELTEFGIAPPGERATGCEMPAIESIQCPNCQSDDTRLESIFGPTLCRSIHYCDACRQSFEHFKAV